MYARYCTLTPVEGQTYLKTLQEEVKHASNLGLTESTILQIRETELSSLLGVEKKKSHSVATELPLRNTHEALGMKKGESMSNSEEMGKNDHTK